MKHARPAPTDLDVESLPMPYRGARGGVRVRTRGLSDRCRQLPLVQRIAAKGQRRPVTMARVVPVPPAVALDHLRAVAEAAGCWVEDATTGATTLDFSDRGRLVPQPYRWNARVSGAADGSEVTLTGLALSQSIGYLEQGRRRGAVLLDKLSRVCTPGPDHQPERVAGLTRTEDLRHQLEEFLAEGHGKPRGEE